MRFRKTRRGVEAQLDPVEVAVLHRCASDLLELLSQEDADEEPQGPRDPLEELVGLPRGEPERPRDPALARLLPDAYGDDPQASKEFRRYTESDLRAGKRAHCTTVLDTLRADGALRLDRDQAAAWLGCLNDLRLVLGARLGVTEELDPDDVDDDDPQAQALQVYSWLGWVQESLLRCLTPRR